MPKPKMPSSGSLKRQVSAAGRTAERKIASAGRQAERDFTRKVRRLERTSGPPSLTFDEQQLVEELHTSWADVPPEVRDLFLSYAHTDGAQVAAELYAALTELGVSVWYDDVVMQPGKSIARQMDRGLVDAEGGVVVLTPAYLTGRFWVERELGALLHKRTVVPVLHGVTFDEVGNYSSFLQDLLGFTTDNNTPAEIAELIAHAVLADQLS